MKTEQIRIAVAECLGWKIDLEEGNVALMGWFKEDLWDMVPDYPTSLDDCAEFEKTLTEEELDRYARELVFLMKTGEPRVFMSPPLRRCIGYLRVKGKWLPD